MNGTLTEFFLTDGLGSILSAITNKASNAIVKGNQGYGPYGTRQYVAAQTGTNKGYTGQYNDPLTGLDNYVSRSYDPVVGVFLSADTAQGNLQGVNPYTYVGGNPETMNDPSGHYYASGSGYNYGLSGPGSLATQSTGWVLPNGSLVTNDYLPAPYNFQTTVSTPQQRQVPAYNPLTDANNSPGEKFARMVGWDKLHGTLSNPNATTADKLNAFKNFGLTNANNILQLAMIFGGPEDDGAELVGDALVSEPGQWELTNEYMSNRAAQYQAQITGRESGWMYRVQGVKFDGYDAERGVLLDAKGSGYAKFVDDAGGFKSWWRGSSGLLDEAQRQVVAANGVPIEWHIAEEQAYNAISNLLNDNGVQSIQMILTPPLP